MALWVCRQDGVAYAVGLPACPQCGSTEHEEDSNMAKISVGDGPSYEPGHDPNGPTVAADVESAPADATAPAPESVDTEPEPEPEPAPAPAPSPKGKQG